MFAQDPRFNFKYEKTKQERTPGLCETRKNKRAEDIVHWRALACLTREALLQSLALKEKAGKQKLLPQPLLTGHWVEVTLIINGDKAGRERTDLIIEPLIVL